MSARLIILATLLLFLIVPGAALSTDVAQDAGVVEQLYGLQVGPEGITFQVFSGGCTTKENFRIQRFTADPIQILLIRVVPDLCEAFRPYGTTLTYSYESLGLENGQSFIVLNPLSPIKVVKQPQLSVASP